MVSESLTLTFNILTGFYSSLALPSIAFRFVTSFFGNWSVLKLSGFCVFFEDDSTDMRETFFKV